MAGTRNGKGTDPSAELVRSLRKHRYLSPFERAVFTRKAIYRSLGLPDPFENVNIPSGFTPGGFIAEEETQGVGAGTPTNRIEPQSNLGSVPSGPPTPFAQPAQGPTPPQVSETEPGAVSGREKPPATAAAQFQHKSVFVPPPPRDLSFLKLPIPQGTFGKNEIGKIKSDGTKTLNQIISDYLPEDLTDDERDAETAAIMALNSDLKINPDTGLIKQGEEIILPNYWIGAHRSSPGVSAAPKRNVIRRPKSLSYDDVRATVEPGYAGRIPPEELSVIDQDGEGILVHPAMVIPIEITRGQWIKEKPKGEPENAFKIISAYQANPNASGDWPYGLQIKVKAVDQTAADWLAINAPRNGLRLDLWDVENNEMTFRYSGLESYAEIAEEIPRLGERFRAPIAKVLHDYYAVPKNNVAQLVFRHGGTQSELLKAVESGWEKVKGIGKKLGIDLTPLEEWRSAADTVVYEVADGEIPDMERILADEKIDLFELLKMYYSNPAKAIPFEDMLESVDLLRFLNLGEAVRTGTATAKETEEFVKMGTVLQAWLKTDRTWPAALTEGVYNVFKFATEIALMALATGGFGEGGLFEGKITMEGLRKAAKKLANREITAEMLEELSAKAAKELGTTEARRSLASRLLGGGKIFLKDIAWKSLRQQWPVIVTKGGTRYLRNLSDNFRIPPKVAGKIFEKFKDNPSAIAQAMVMMDSALNNPTKEQTILEGYARALGAEYGEYWTEYLGEFLPGGKATAERILRSRFGKNAVVKMTANMIARLGDKLEGRLGRLLRLGKFNEIVPEMLEEYINDAYAYLFGFDQNTMRYKNMSPRLKVLLKKWATDFVKGDTALMFATFAIPNIIGGIAGGRFKTDRNEYIRGIYRDILSSLSSGGYKDDERRKISQIKAVIESRMKEEGLDPTSEAEKFAEDVERANVATEEAVNAVIRHAEQADREEGQQTATTASPMGEALPEVSNQDAVAAQVAANMQVERIESEKQKKALEKQQKSEQQKELRTQQAVKNAQADARKDIADIGTLTNKELEERYVSVSAKRDIAEAEVLRVLEKGGVDINNQEEVADILSGNDSVLEYFGVDPEVIAQMRGYTAALAAIKAEMTARGMKETEPNVSEEELQLADRALAEDIGIQPPGVVGRKTTEQAPAEQRTEEAENQGKKAEAPPEAAVSERKTKETRPKGGAVTKGQKGRPVEVAENTARKSKKRKGTTKKAIKGEGASEQPAIAMKPEHTAEGVGPATEVVAGAVSEKRQRKQGKKQEVAQESKKGRKITKQERGAEERETAAKEKEIKQKEERKAKKKAGESTTNRLRQTQKEKGYVTIDDIARESGFPKMSSEKKKKLENHLIVLAKIGPTGKQRKAPVEFTNVDGENRFRLTARMANEVRNLAWAAEQGTLEQPEIVEADEGKARRELKNPTTNEESRKKTEIENAEEFEVENEKKEKRGWLFTIFDTLADATEKDLTPDGKVKIKKRNVVRFILNTLGGIMKRGHKGMPVDSFYAVTIEEFLDGMKNIGVIEDGKTKGEVYLLVGPAIRFLRDLKLSGLGRSGIDTLLTFSRKRERVSKGIETAYRLVEDDEFITEEPIAPDNAKMRLGGKADPFEIIEARANLLRQEVERKKNQITEKEKTVKRGQEGRGLGAKVSEDFFAIITGRKELVFENGQPKIVERKPTGPAEQAEFIARLNRVSRFALGLLRGEYGEQYHYGTNALMKMIFSDRVLIREDMDKNKPESIEFLKEDEVEAPIDYDGRTTTIKIGTAERTLLTWMYMVNKTARVFSRTSIGETLDSGLWNRIFYRRRANPALMDRGIDHGLMVVALRINQLVVAPQEITSEEEARQSVGMMNRRQSISKFASLVPSDITPTDVNEIEKLMFSLAGKAANNYVRSALRSTNLILAAVSPIANRMKGLKNERRELERTLAINQKLRATLYDLSRRGVAVTNEGVLSLEGFGEDMLKKLRSIGVLSKDGKVQIPPTIPVLDAESQRIRAQINQNEAEMGRLNELLIEEAHMAAAELSKYNESLNKVGAVDEEEGNVEALGITEKKTAEFVAESGLLEHLNDEILPLLASNARIDHFPAPSAAHIVEMKLADDEYKEKRDNLDKISNDLIRSAKSKDEDKAIGILLKFMTGQDAMTLNLPEGPINLAVTPKDISSLGPSVVTKYLSNKTSTYLRSLANALARIISNGESGMSPEEAMEAFGTAASTIKRAEKDAEKLWTGIDNKRRSEIKKALADFREAGREWIRVKGKDIRYRKIEQSIWDKAYMNGEDFTEFDGTTYLVGALDPVDALKTVTDGKPIDELARLLKVTGLERTLTIRFVKNILNNERRAFGMYSGSRRLIALALDPGLTTETVRHEVWHAAFDVLLTPAERRIVLREFLNLIDTYDKTVGADNPFLTPRQREMIQMYLEGGKSAADTIYDYWSKENMSGNKIPFNDVMDDFENALITAEEAAAHAFQSLRENNKAVSRSVRIINAIKNVLLKLRNFLRELIRNKKIDPTAFATWRSIMENVDAGKINLDSPGRRRSIGNLEPVPLTLFGVPESEISRLGHVGQVVPMGAYVVTGLPKGFSVGAYVPNHVLSSHGMRGLWTGEGGYLLAPHVKFILFDRNGYAVYSSNSYFGTQSTALVEALNSAVTENKRIGNHSDDDLLTFFEGTPHLPLLKIAVSKQFRDPATGGILRNNGFVYITDRDEDGNIVLHVRAPSGAYVNQVSNPFRTPEQADAAILEYLTTKNLDKEDINYEALVQHNLRTFGKDIGPVKYRNIAEEKIDNKPRFYFKRRNALEANRDLFMVAGGIIKSVKGGRFEKWTPERINKEFGLRNKSESQRIYNALVRHGIISSQTGTITGRLSLDVAVHIPEVNAAISDYANLRRRYELAVESGQDEIAASTKQEMRDHLARNLVFKDVIIAGAELYRNPSSNNIDEKMLNDIQEEELDRLIQNVMPESDISERKKSLSDDKVKKLSEFFIDFVRNTITPALTNRIESGIKTAVDAVGQAIDDVNLRIIKRAGDAIASTGIYGTILSQMIKRHAELTSQKTERFIEAFSNILKGTGDREAILISKILDDELLAMYDFQTVTGEDLGIELTSKSASEGAVIAAERRMRAIAEAGGKNASLAKTFLSALSKSREIGGILDGAQIEARDYGVKRFIPGKGPVEFRPTGRRFPHVLSGEGRRLLEKARRKKSERQALIQNVMNGIQSGAPKLEMEMWEEYINARMALESQIEGRKVGPTEILAKISEESGSDLLGQLDFTGVGILSGRIEGINEDFSKKYRSFVERKINEEVDNMVSMTNPRPPLRSLTPWMGYFTSTRRGRIDDLLEWDIRKVLPRWSERAAYFLSTVSVFGPKNERLIHIMKMIDEFDLPSPSDKWIHTMISDYVQYQFAGVRDQKGYDRLLRIGSRLVVGTMMGYSPLQVVKNATQPILNSPEIGIIEMIRNVARFHPTLLPDLLNKVLRIFGKRIDLTEREREYALALMTNLIPRGTALAISDLGLRGDTDALAHALKYFLEQESLNKIFQGYLLRDLFEESIRTVMRLAGDQNDSRLLEMIVRLNASIDNMTSPIYASNFPELTSVMDTSDKTIAQMKQAERKLGLSEKAALLFLRYFAPTPLNRSGYQLLTSAINFLARIPGTDVVSDNSILKRVHTYWKKTDDIYEEAINYLVAEKGMTEPEAARELARLSRLVRIFIEHGGMDTPVYRFKVAEDAQLLGQQVITVVTGDEENGEERDGSEDRSPMSIILAPIDDGVSVIKFLERYSNLSDVEITKILIRMLRTAIMNRHFPQDVYTQPMAKISSLGQAIALFKSFPIGQTRYAFSVLRSAAKFGEWDKIFKMTFWSIVLGEIYNTVYDLLTISDRSMSRLFYDYAMGRGYSSREMPNQLRAALARDFASIAFLGILMDVAQFGVQSTIMGATANWVISMMKQSLRSATAKEIPLTVKTLLSNLTFDVFPAGRSTKGPIAFARTLLSPDYKAIPMFIWRGRSKRFTIGTHLENEDSIAEKMASLFTGASDADIGSVTNRNYATNRGTWINVYENDESQAKAYIRARFSQMDKGEILSDLNGLKATMSKQSPLSLQSQSLAPVYLSRLQPGAQTRLGELTMKYYERYLKWVNDVLEEHGLSREFTPSAKAIGVALAAINLGGGGSPSTLLRRADQLLDKGVSAEERARFLSQVSSNMLDVIIRARAAEWANKLYEGDEAELFELLVGLNNRNDRLKIFGEFEEENIPLSVNTLRKLERRAKRQYKIKSGVLRQTLQRLTGRTVSGEYELFSEREKEFLEKYGGNING